MCSWKQTLKFLARIIEQNSTGTSSEQFSVHSPNVWLKEAVGRKDRDLLTSVRNPGRHGARPTQKQNQPAGTIVPASRDGTNQQARKRYSWRS